MSGTTEEAERLRAAFAGGRTASPGDCPPADRIWEAAAGALSGAEVGPLVDHAAGCAACAEAWRLAKEMGAAQGADAAPAAARVDEPARRRSRARRIVAMGVAAAAAAAIMIVAGVRLLGGGPGGGDEPIFRGGDAVVRSLLPEDRPLPRAGAVLRWEGPPGAVYDITLGAEDLSFTTTVTGHTATDLPVSRDDLARLPPGTRLVWRVTAQLPDGTRVQSPAFISRIE